MKQNVPFFKASLKFSWVLLIVIAIAILLRILNLGSREFWYDEVLSLLVSTGQGINYRGPKQLPVDLSDYTALLNLPSESSIGNVLETVKNIFKSLLGDVHPPVSFLSLHVWLRLFGNSEVALRGLVTLLSAGAIASAYGLGRFLMGHRGGLLLAALLAANPYYLSHSLTIRMYGFLILWTILSAWALLELVGVHNLGLKTQREVNSDVTSHTDKSIHPFVWSLILIGSVVAGLLTQYLFAYWVLTLGIFVLIFDWRHWWQHGLRLGAGVLLAVPWVLWGTRQQLNNRGESVSQISNEDTSAVLQHFQDVTQTLGAHLVVGDWITSLPPAIVTLAGCIAIVVLGVCIATLWRQGQHRSLRVALALGILPLVLALSVDVITGKFTVGFGWGRAIIFILPGCLLLLALGLERAAEQWRIPLTVALLLFFLSVSVADLGTRPRWMFHQVAVLIEQDATAPTLIAMNSRAWGHVLRLAYYIPSKSPVMLLAQSSDKLIPALEKALVSKPAEYQRLLWLDSAAPVWGSPSTDAQKQQIQQIIEGQFKLEKTLPLTGTMKFDNFTAHLYRRP